MTSWSRASGAVHRVCGEAARLQQVGLEALQDHPRGRRLVRAQQGAQGLDQLPQLLAARTEATQRKRRVRTTYHLHRR